MISLLVVCHFPNFRRYEYNTILFYGLCNILCILTSYAPLHLMVKLRMRFCNSTQEEVVHSCVDRKLKDFQKYHRFAGTTILLCFIYALLPCVGFIVQTKEGIHNIIKRMACLIPRLGVITISIKM